MVNSPWAQGKLPLFDSYLFCLVETLNLHEELVRIAQKPGSDPILPLASRGRQHSVYWNVDPTIDNGGTRQEWISIALPNDFPDDSAGDETVAQSHRYSLYPVQV
jgi:hypothetical protein